VWTKSGNNIYNTNTEELGLENQSQWESNHTSDTSNVLFEVRDKNGIPVFVVYQDSVQVL
jgi:hypothetical protein